MYTYNGVEVFQSNHIKCSKISVASRLPPRIRRIRKRLKYNPLTIQKAEMVAMENKIFVHPKTFMEMAKSGQLLAPVPIKMATKFGFALRP